MEEALTINAAVIIPGGELRFTASRSGGPGGQHVNTTSSRVSLHWNVRATGALTWIQKNQLLHRLANRISADGVLTVTVDTERSQHANRQIARDRLAEMVRKALVKPKRRVPTKIPKGAKEKRLRAKAKRSSLKQQRSNPAASDD